MDDFIELSTMILYRFDPKEPITHGVETLNHCEINVDVAVAGKDTWTLQSEKAVHAKMIGNDNPIHACLVPYRANLRIIVLAT